MPLKGIFLLRKEYLYSENILFNLIKFLRCERYCIGVVTFLGAFNGNFILALKDLCIAEIVRANASKDRENILSSNMLGSNKEKYSLYSEKCYFFRVNK